MPLHHLKHANASFFDEHHLEAALRLVEAAARRGEEGSTVWLPRDEATFLESLKMPSPLPNNRPPSFIAVVPDLLDLRRSKIEPRCDF